MSKNLKSGKAEQVNAMTGKAYQGGNQLELAAASQANNYQSNRWATFLQMKQLGLQVKPGQHGTRIVKIIENEYQGEDQQFHVRRGVRGYVVFNLDQTIKAGDLVELPAASVKVLELGGPR